MKAKQMLTKKQIRLFKVFCFLSFHVRKIEIFLRKIPTLEEDFTNYPKFVKRVSFKIRTDGSHMFLSLPLSLVSIISAAI